jgi:ankyrin repeat protein
MSKTEFVEAAANNDLHRIKQMLESNGDLLNAKDRESDTAIMKACRNCNATDVVSFLLEKGANINDKLYRDLIDQTPLIIAAQHGCAHIVSLLIENGITDINHKNDQGESALLAATQEGHKEVVQILLDAGADINQPNSDGETALAIVTRNRHKKDYIDFLIANGALMSIEASGIKKKKKNRRRKTKRSKKNKRRTIRKINK